MEHLLDIETPSQKIYRDRAIWVGTFLGGPLIAGYLIAHNFEAFGESHKATKTWIYAVVATVIIFGTAFLIPETIKIPNQLIPLIYTGIAYYLVHHFQGKSITTHVDNGGQFYSWWRAIGVSMVGLGIMVISFLGFVLLSDTASNATISVKAYGTMKHEMLFDKDNISENEVDKLAQALITTGFFDDAFTKYVFAEIADEDYDLSISVIAGLDDEGYEPFRELRNDLQVHFPDKKINFNLVVDNLDNVVKRIE